MGSQKRNLANPGLSGLTLPQLQVQRLLGEKLSKVNFYKFKWTGGRTCDHGYSTPSFIAENNGLGKIQVEGFREHQGASQFQTMIPDNKSPSPRISRDPRDEKIHENLNINIMMNRGSLK